MRNKFPGICYRCGGHVAAGEGHFERSERTKGWRVQHAKCAIKYRGTDFSEGGEFERPQKATQALSEDTQ